MTREQIKAVLPFAQAFAEGKKVQLKACHGWEDTVSFRFDADPSAYRIKPEPQNIFVIWNGCWPDKYRSYFNTKDEAEQWKSESPGREYRHFREVLE